MGKYLFYNAMVITPTGITPGSVLVHGRKIAEVHFEEQLAGMALPVRDAVPIDCKGLYLSPGFIDIHTHGAGGHDFMDGTKEAIRAACQAHLKHGTTSIVPTTLTSTKQSMMDILELFNTIDFEEANMPSILGLHLEGPYFSYEQRGAQDPRYLRDPDPQEYLAALQLSDRILRWSFAVELPGSLEFLAALNERGIVASVAHSNATCQEVMRAHENGVCCLTHFYSGMSSVIRKNAFRVAGVVEAGYLLPDMVVEVIADGCHLPSELLQLIYKIKGSSHICLVTDSMRGAGLPEGDVIMLGDKEHGIPAIIEDGVAKLMDRSAFAGSVATADRLVRTFRELTKAPLHEVIKMISLNPAVLVGVADKKGSIAVNKDADLLVFDEDIRIQHTMVRGEMLL